MAASHVAKRGVRVRVSVSVRVRVRGRVRVGRTSLSPAIGRGTEREAWSPWPSTPSQPPPKLSNAPSAHRMSECSAPQPTSTGCPAQATGCGVETGSPHSRSSPRPRWATKVSPSSYSEEPPQASTFPSQMLRLWLPPEAHVISAGVGVAWDLGSSCIVLDGERSPADPPRWMGFAVGSWTSTLASAEAAVHIIRS